MVYKKSTIKDSLIFLVFIVCSFSVAPHIHAADSYQLLAPIPLSGANGTPDKTVDIDNITKTYIPGLIKLVIGLAGAIAVVMIVVGGFEYVTSASGMSKSDGKERITNALIGLFIAIGSWLILFTLNPDLVKFNLSLSEVSQTPPSVTQPTSPTNPNPSPGPAPIETCANCTFMPVTIPAKKASEGGCASPGPCTLNATLINELQRMANNMPSNVTWRVTEMYPPTVPHISSCHDNGTCADASVDNPTNDDILLAFLKAADMGGFSSFVYESCTRLSQLKSNPKFKDFWGNFACYSTTQGENLHVNM